MSESVALCMDIGSTYTKGAAVRLDTGELLGTAEHPTTVESDVMVGVQAVRQELSGFSDQSTLLACSSAGGGLRLAVVGYEREISAEAGQRAALSAGARVVQVSAGRLDSAGVAALRTAAADVVLLVGGTDGGESGVLLHNAAVLASAGLEVPVVVAGNADVRHEVCARLESSGVTAVPTDNVLPDIGVLDPEPARTAIRGVFLEHVIGGKGLSADPGFARMVRAVTPDAVLDGVSVLAEALRARAARTSASVGNVVVVDVGGATTDVYCVVSPDAEAAAQTPATSSLGLRRAAPVPTPATSSLGLRRAAPRVGREAVGVPTHRRTVEGDLGLRWSAAALVVAAAGERLLLESERRDLGLWVDSRPDVSGRPASDEDRANELRLAGLAVIIALRRHVRAEAAYGVSGNAGASARTASTVILSGGAIRHATELERASLAEFVLADRGGARGVLLDAEVRCDSRYVLAAAGLLARDFPAAAQGLVRAGGLLG